MKAFSERWYLHLYRKAKDLDQLYQKYPINVDTFRYERLSKWLFDRLERKKELN